MSPRRFLGSGQIRRHICVCVLASVHCFFYSLYVFGGMGFLTGAMSLTMADAGNFTLGGSHSYTGATTVQSGTLTLAGTLNGSSIVVLSGAALGGNRSITGCLSPALTCASMAASFHKRSER